MRGFIAMLRDSFREAVDGWIFVVMLGLAGVVTLLVASASVTPLSADQAVPRMANTDGGGPGLGVRGDRGHGPKPAVFFLRLEASEAESGGTGPDAWARPLTFVATFRKTNPSRFAPAGVIFELGEDRLPADAASLKDLIIPGDPFKEAVRYWATPTGGSKPAFTEELAREFVASHLLDTGRLHATEVKRKTGGLLGGMLGGNDPTFSVTCGPTDRLAWGHYPNLLFGAVSLDFDAVRRPLGNLVYTLESTLITGIGAWVLLLTAVVVTAGFVPNMLRKGAIDLLLTKPISRPLILWYKYLGGLLFVLLIFAVTALGVWAAVGLRTGVWAPGVLLSVGGVTFYFAILYACSTLVGVLTRNAIVSIVLTVVFWFLVWLVGVVYAGLNVWDSVNVMQTALQGARQAEVKADKGDKKADKPADDEAPPAAAEPQSKIPRWLLLGFKYANKLTPRTGDLDTLTSGMIAKGLLSPADEVRRDSRDTRWAEVLAVAGGWIALLMGLATVRFVTRSY